MSNIYKAINSIMSEMDAISKGKKNQQQGFMYRGIDDVMNALQPLLSKHRVFIVPEILEQTREERVTVKKGSNDSSYESRLMFSICKIKYTFFADDGSSVYAVVIGEAMDSGDKATNKAMAIAFKYACFQVFCIPTEEVPDPDADTPPEVLPKKTPDQKGKEPPKELATPENMANLKAKCAELGVSSNDLAKKAGRKFTWHNAPDDSLVLSKEDYLAAMQAAAELSEAS